MTVAKALPTGCGKNDRSLQGMKGTISELEVASLRERAQAALIQKARRGELFVRMPIGYVLTPGDRVEKDPDERVRTLATIQPDSMVALILNRLRLRTAHGLSWTAMRVCSVRSHHGIALKEDVESMQSATGHVNGPPTRDVNQLTLQIQ